MCSSGRNGTAKKKQNLQIFPKPSRKYLNSTDCSCFVPCVLIDYLQLSVNSSTKKWENDTWNNLLSIFWKFSPKHRRMFLFSSFFSLVLTQLLMLKKSLQRLIYLQIMVDSLIFPWDKVKKTELKRLFSIAPRKDIGSCFKMSISCKTGFMA
jgi:hypothetical protein